jgi:hypothetical protein
VGRIPILPELAAEIVSEGVGGPAARQSLGVAPVHCLKARAKLFSLR